MQLNLKTINKTLIVSAFGEIDHHTSEDVRDKIDRYIDASSAKNIIFDFTGVSFMDSAGIGVIIGRYKKISPLGGKFAITGANAQVKRIIEISGILKIARYYDNVDIALSNM
jgi:stage II sporulation protein AA (anti-sigma F factor antagonist)